MRTKAVSVRRALSSYLSVLCRISLPLFHRVIAGGDAWGLHSRVTSLPERAFSKAFNGLLEKLGGEAVCFGCGRDRKMHNINKDKLNVSRSAA